MNDRYGYRNLILWQRAQELAHDRIQVTQRPLNTWAAAVIARQIRASVIAIGAKIAEGYGRFAPGAYRNHLSVAHGSTAETDSWLDLLYREGLLEQRLHERCRQLPGRLTTRMNALDAESRSIQAPSEKALVSTASIGGSIQLSHSMKLMTAFKFGSSVIR